MQVFTLQRNPEVLAQYRKHKEEMAALVSSQGSASENADRINTPSASTPSSDATPSLSASSNNALTTDSETSYT